MKIKQVLLSAIPICLIVSSVLIPSVGAATDPVVTWNQTNPSMPQLLPSTKYTTSSIASTNSKGKKIWSVSGSCTLKNGKISTKASGFCKIKLVVQAKGKFGKKAFSKNMKIIPAPPPLLKYKQSVSWGEVSVTQMASPSPQSCVQIPITLDVRSQSGLFYGLVVEIKDDYENVVGEIRPSTTNGVQDLTIQVCRDPWVYTFPSGVTSNRSGSLYCGLNIGFWPGSYPTIKYLWNDRYCINSSDRLQ